MYHPFSTYPTFPVKVTFLTPRYTHAHTYRYHGVRAFKFTKTFSCVLNGWSQTTIQPVCLILTIIVRIITTGILFIEIIVIICFWWNISTRLGLKYICAHHCIANKTATVKKTTLFKGSWYKFQYSIWYWLFIRPVYARF